MPTALHYLLIILLHLYSAHINANWIYSSDSTTILIGEAFNPSNGFFNSLTFDNVSIISNDTNINSLNVNFYIVGDDITSNSNINLFITWMQSNQCPQDITHSDISEYNVPSVMNTNIFYRCKLSIPTGNQMSLTFEFTSPNEIFTQSYNTLTWILEISLTNEAQFYLPTHPFLNNLNKHFTAYLNQTFTKIQTFSVDHFIYTINYNCQTCHTLTDTDITVWDFETITVNNSFKWHFAQEFYPSQINIASLTSFQIDIKCNFEFIMLPNLIGFSSIHQFTNQSLWNYVTYTSPWPTPHFSGSNNKLNTIFSTNETVLFWKPITLNITDIDLTQKDYYVWVLSLHTVLNDGGICLMRRSVGPETAQYLQGNSMQLTIPGLQNVFLNTYQDFLIRMGGLPFPTNNPTITPTNDGLIDVSDTEKPNTNAPNVEMNSVKSEMLMYIIIGAAICCCVCVILWTVFIYKYKHKSISNDVAQKDEGYAYEIGPGTPKIQHQSDVYMSNLSNSVMIGSDSPIITQPLPEPPKRLNVNDEQNVMIKMNDEGIEATDNIVAEGVEYNDNADSENEMEQRMTSTGGNTNTVYVQKDDTDSEKMYGL